MSGTGLILPGGGAWGEIQAAEICALDAAGLLKDVTRVYGTSAGSINGAVFSHSRFNGAGVDVLRNTWAGIQQNTQIYTPDIVPMIEHPWQHPILEAELSHGAVWGLSALSTAPLEALLRGILGEATTDQVDAIGTIFRAMTYDNGRGAGRIVKGKLWRMAKASSAIPVVFPAHLGLSDGGVVANNPVTLALDEGCDKIILCYCGPEIAPMPTEELWLDDSASDPQTKSLAVAVSILQNISQINESLAERLLNDAVKAGRCKAIEVWPNKTGDELGSILDFRKLFGRWEAGDKAASIAIEKAKSANW